MSLAAYKHQVKGYIILTDTRRGNIIPNKHGMIPVIGSSSFDSIEENIFLEEFALYKGKKTIPQIKKFLQSR